MIKSFKEWLAGVEKHYGSLDAFDDATTVRNMRREELAIIHGHERVSREIEDEGGRAEYDEIFSGEINEAKANVDLCDKWLYERGLKP